MGKKISGKEGPVFGIKSSSELFIKLKYESDRLQKEWHPYDAFNFLVTAWHLFADWPKSDDPHALCRSKRQRSKLPDHMNLLLDVVRDLANGSKHFHLKPQSENKRRVSEVHAGREAGWYSWLFHENLPAVTVEGHWYFSICVLNKLVIRYFEWVFDDSVPVKDFPQDLLDAILYCNIANRKRGKKPKLLLIGTTCVPDNKNNDKDKSKIITTT